MVSHTFDWPLARGRFKCLNNDKYHCTGVGNNDVAGLGVLLAFIIIAGATLMTAWIDLLFNQTGKRQCDESKIQDRYFLQWLTSWAPMPIMAQRWSEVNYRMTHIFSDQLIVTGIAVLVAGFANNAALSVYHFQIVTWQAWLASNSHQITLTILQHYLRSHATVLYFRAIAMTVMYLMLFIAIVLAGPPTSGYCRSYKHFDANVRDTWTSQCLKSLSIDVAFSLSLLSVNYIARLLKAFKKSAQWSNRWFRQKPGVWLKALYDYSAGDGNLSWWNAFPFCVFVTYCLGRTVCDMYESRVFELLWLSCTFVFGCTKIFAWRDSTPPGYGENTWTFGQILAVLGLLLPFLAFPQLYAETKETSQKPSSTNQDNLPEDVDHIIRQAPRVETVQLLANPPSRAQKRHTWRKDILESSKKFYQDSWCFTCLAFLIPLTVLAYFVFLIAIHVWLGPGENYLLRLLTQDLEDWGSRLPDTAVVAPGALRVAFLVFVTPMVGLLTIWLVIASWCGAI